MGMQLMMWLLLSAPVFFGTTEKGRELPPQDGYVFTDAKDFPSTRKDLPPAPEGWKRTTEKGDIQSGLIGIYKKEEVKSLVDGKAAARSKGYWGIVVIAKDHDTAVKAITPIIQEWRVQDQNAFRMMRECGPNAIIAVQCTIPEGLSNDDVLFARGEVMAAQGELAAWAGQKVTDLSKPVPSFDDKKTPAPKGQSNTIPDKQKELPPEL